ncbi:hypothetical protein MASR1M59_26310 [Melaminivora sp.]
MLLHGGGQALGQAVQRLVPGHGLWIGAARAALLRLQQAHLGREFGPGRQVQGRALGAQPPLVGRVLRVAAHAGDAAGLALDQHAAADAAVRTGGGGGGLHARRLVRAG